MIRDFLLSTEGESWYMRIFREAEHSPAAASALELVDALEPMVGSLARSKDLLVMKAMSAINTEKSNVTRLRLALEGWRAQNGPALEKANWVKSIVTQYINQELSP